MSEPRRWKDSADAPIGVRELLREARAAGGAPAFDDAVRRRGQARIAKLAALPVAAGAATALWSKLAAAGLVGVAAVSVAVVASSRADRTDAEHRARIAMMPSEGPAHLSAGARAAARGATASAIAVADGLVAPASPAQGAARSAPAAFAPAGSPAASVATASARPTSAPMGVLGADAAALVVPTADAGVEPSASSVSAPPVDRSTLGDELALLADARRHLATDPDLALRRAAFHRSRFPRGILAAERDLLELEALRASGRIPEARLRAEAWLRRDSTGIHADRVRAILATLPR